MFLAQWLEQWSHKPSVTGSNIVGHTIQYKGVIMSDRSYLNHPSFPGAQPFQYDAGRKNKTKTQSWWNVGSKTYWKDAHKNKQKKQES